MNVAMQILAHRYAHAYLNVFGSSLSMHDIEMIQKAKQFFFEHKKVLYFLSLPTIVQEKKLAVMHDVFSKLEVPASMNQLIKLLITQKRVLLWHEILKDIIQSYQERRHIMEVSVATASPIGEQEMEVVRQFFMRKTGYDIIIGNHQICTDLVAGIRVESDTLLWECSIAKNMRAIRQSLLQ